MGEGHQRAMWNALGGRKRDVNSALRGRGQDNVLRIATCAVGMTFEVGWLPALTLTHGWVPAEPLDVAPTSD